MVKLEKVSRRKKNWFYRACSFFLFCIVLLSPLLLAACDGAYNPTDENGNSTIPLSFKQTYRKTRLVDTDPDSTDTVLEDWLKGVNYGSNQAGFDQFGEKFLEALFGNYLFSSYGLNGTSGMDESLTAFLDFNHDDMQEKFWDWSPVFDLGMSSISGTKWKWEIDTSIILSEIVSPDREMIALYDVLYFLSDVYSLFSPGGDSAFVSDFPVFIDNLFNDKTVLNSLLSEPFVLATYQSKNADDLYKIFTQPSILNLLFTATGKTMTGWATSRAVGFPINLYPSIISDLSFAMQYTVMQVMLGQANLGINGEVDSSLLSYAGLTAMDPEKGEKVEYGLQNETMKLEYQRKMNYSGILKMDADAIIAMILDYVIGYDAINADYNAWVAGGKKANDDFFRRYLDVIPHIVYTLTTDGFSPEFCDGFTADAYMAASKADSDAKNAMKILIDRYYGTDGNSILSSGDIFSNLTGNGNIDKIYMSGGSSQMNELDNWYASPATYAVDVPREQGHVNFRVLENNFNYFKSQPGTYPFLGTAVPKDGASGIYYASSPETGGLRYNFDFMHIPYREYHTMVLMPGDEFNPFPEKIASSFAFQDIEFDFMARNLGLKINFGARLWSWNATTGKGTLYQTPWKTVAFDALSAVYDEQTAEKQGTTSTKKPVYVSRAGISVQDFFFSAQETEAIRNGSFPKPDIAARYEAAMLTNTSLKKLEKDYGTRYIFELDTFRNSLVGLNASTEKLTSDLDYRIIRSSPTTGGLSVLDERKITFTFLEILFDIEKDAGTWTDYAFRPGISIVI